MVLKVDTQIEDLGNLFQEATAMQLMKLESLALGTILLKKKSMLTLMMVMIGVRLQADLNTEMIACARAKPCRRRKGGPRIAMKTH